MESDSEDKYQRYANIPIPSYDEATLARSGSSPTFRGAQEVSDDAERQGLLGESTYRPPTVESPRGSEDSDLHLPEVGGDDDERRLNVEELDYLDPNAPDPDNLYHRPRMRNKFTHHLSSLGATLSSLRLPSFRSLYTPVQAHDASDPEPSSDGQQRPSHSRWASFLATLPRIPTVPEQYRMGLPTAARLCALFTIIILIYILFSFDIFPGGRGRYLGRGFNPEAVRMFVQDNVDARSIEEYLKHITAYDHVAGTEGDLYMAEWMRERWIAEGNLDQVDLHSYYVYLNYPTPDGREVSIVSPEDKRWKALLEEERVDVGKVQTLAWHGHSKSGDVTGPLIYANGGSREDFEWLKQNGVTLNGSVALMRYYGTQGDRALKIKAAEEVGCIGALIYSDPSDDGSGRGPVWPDGPWRPDDSIQRGGVSLMSWIVGDPLTPGYASTKDQPTLDHEHNPGLVQIPSLPLAWRDAKVLLQSIQHIGIPVPQSWVGGSSDFVKTWYSGGTGDNAVNVRVKNINDENDKQQIWNLHGRIEGVEQPQKKIIIGNHRDSWCFGSVDPGSGSAVMMEIVRIFGQLAFNKWRPLRTIEFVSWDAEEYNLVGSTEYVEDNIHELRANGVAYINVDVGIGGAFEDLQFRAAGSPMWARALMHVLDRVDAPGKNASLKDIWESSNSALEGLGAGSDYVAFQDMAGTSSVDFGFEGKVLGFPYHSCYESFEWMKKFGDPDFAWHKALAQVWALMILEIADHPVLPFDLRAFADAVRGEYIDGLLEYAESTFQAHGGKRGKLKEKTGFDLEPLRQSAGFLTDRAADFVHFEDLWTTNVLTSGGLESLNYAKHRIKYNNILSNFETQLLDLVVDKDDNSTHGIPGREQFKHVIFGPQAWSGYDVGYFPAVRDAVERGDWEHAQEWVEKIAEILRRAGEGLHLG